VSRRRVCVPVLIAVGLMVGLVALVACEPDYRQAGQKTGELWNEAGTRVAADPTAASEWRATDAARAREIARTAAAEVGERVPTLAVDVGEAAQEFREGFRESEACGSAAMILVGVGAVVAVVRRGRP
jgi:hypothetical protein